MANSSKGKSACVYFRAVDERIGDLSITETGGILPIVKKLAFISHSSRDKDLATGLVVELRKRGVAAWIDHEKIGFGDSIPRKIVEGLESADVILVLISKEFLGSQWCRSEYEPLIVREIESGRTSVIPVRLDNAEMPVFLKAKRYVDLRSGMSAKILDELGYRYRINRKVFE